MTAFRQEKSKIYVFFQSRNFYDYFKLALYSFRRAIKINDNGIHFISFSLPDFEKFFDEASHFGSFFERHKNGFSPKKYRKSEKKRSLDVFLFIERTY
jgi:hypothetical protein